VYNIFASQVFKDFIDISVRIVFMSRMTASCIFCQHRKMTESKLITQWQLICTQQQQHTANLVLRLAFSVDDVFIFVDNSCSLASNCTTLHCNVSNPRHFS